MGNVDGATANGIGFLFEVMKMLTVVMVTYMNHNGSPKFLSLNMNFNKNHKIVYFK